jgi:hypothetical protein
MKKIKLILSLALLLILNNSFAQINEKNREYCKTKLINTDKLYQVQSFYEIPVLNDTEKQDLMTYLYQSNKSIFDISIENNVITISHLSDITIVDLKSLLVNKNYYIKFINSQELIEEKSYETH